MPDGRTPGGTDTHSFGDHNLISDDTLEIVTLVIMDGKRLWSAVGSTLRGKSTNHDLTHWPLEDMAVIMKDDVLIHVTDWILEPVQFISSQLMPQDPVEDKSALCQVMAWSR